MSRGLGRSVPLAGMAVVLCYPALFTWLYYGVLSEAPAALQQGTFLAGKAVQLLLALALLPGARERRAPGRGSVLAAVALGLVVAAGAVLLLSPASPWPELRDLFGVRLGGRLGAFGVVKPWTFAALGLFYATTHSLFEEVYWRAVVYRGLRARLSPAPAALLSGAGFAAHHVVLLSVLFGAATLPVWLLGAAVATGGVFWALIYERTGSLRWPWVSHGLVDAGLFLAAGLLLFAP